MSARRPLALAAALACVRAAAAEPGDPHAGEAAFRRVCAACHMVGPDARSRVGPPLNGIFGRRAGRHEAFEYSPFMRRMGDDGLAWTFETLDAYLQNPRALVSGTRMSLRGIADPGERADILAYLRDFSDRPRDIPEAEPTAPGLAHASAPDFAGDPAFGEYLSAECTTCHRRDGASAGIPAIVGWPQEDFVAAMNAYRRRLRPHPVMQMMAGRLSDEEIAALAAYYAQAGP